MYLRSAGEVSGLWATCADEREAVGLCSVPDRGMWDCEVICEFLKHGGGAGSQGAVKLAYSPWTAKSCRTARQVEDCKKKGRYTGHSDFKVSM